MKIEDIKKRPNAFDFKVSGNPWETTYHAKETEQGYEIIWNLGNRIITDTCSKEHFHRMLFNGAYYLVC